MNGEVRSLLIPAAAERLGVSRRTIYNYVRDGKLRTVRVGRSQRILLDSIIELQRQAIDDRKQALEALEQTVNTNRVNARG